MTFGLVIMLIAVAAVLWALVGGIGSMVVAGEFGASDGEHWMYRRVALQGLAVLLLVVMSFAGPV